MSRKIKPIPVLVENTLCNMLQVKHDEHHGLNIKLGDIRIYVAHAHNDEAIFDVSVFDDEGMNQVVAFRWIKYLRVEVENDDGAGFMFENGSFSVFIQGDDDVYYVGFKYDKDSGNGVIVVHRREVESGFLVVHLGWRSEY